jgi:hypothetical protein
MNKYTGATVFETTENVCLHFLFYKTRYTYNNTKSVRACVFKAMSAKCPVMESYELLVNSIRRNADNLTDGNIWRKVFLLEYDAL